MVLKSSAFTDLKPIPPRYTADGANVSPPLAWEGAPPGVKSFALIADDPDAPGGVWVHWVIYNIPARTNALPENVPPAPEPSPGVRQGVNDFRKTGYGGPSPPSGTHRYVFTLYALDAEIPLAPGASKQALLKAMQGRVLDHTSLTATYRR